MTRQRASPHRLSYCAAQVRQSDYDRYLCSLFAPDRQREALFAIYAFNVEVAKTREAVSEPMLGHIRLQWWRETIDGIYAGTPRRHDVVEPLGTAIQDFGLPRAPFDHLIDGREFDLQDAPPANLDALETYAESTAVPVFELGLGVFAVNEEDALQAARALGLAWALTGLIRSIPFHARAHRQFLPADLMVQAEVDPSALFELRGGPGLSHAVEQVADAARRHLESARELHSAVPKAAHAVMLPAVPAGLYLRQLARMDHDVMAGPIEIGRITRQTRLAVAALRNRY